MGIRIPVAVVRPRPVWQVGRGRDRVLGYWRGERDMAATVEAHWLEVFSAILDGSHLFQPDGLATAVDAALEPLGIGATIFLVDEEQRMLRPVPRPGRPLPAPQPVATTPAGRAFALVTSTATGDDGWWVPIVNGTD